MLRTTIFWGTQCRRTVRLSIFCTPIGMAPKGRLLRIDLDKRSKTIKLFLLRQNASQKRSEIPSDIDKPLSFQRNMFVHAILIVVLSSSDTEESAVYTLLRYETSISKTDLQNLVSTGWKSSYCFLSNDQNDNNRFIPRPRTVC